MTHPFFVQADYDYFVIVRTSCLLESSDFQRTIGGARPDLVSLRTFFSRVGFDVMVVGVEVLQRISGCLLLTAEGSNALFDDGVRNTRFSL